MTFVVHDIHFAASQHCCLANNLLPQLYCTRRSRPVHPLSHQFQLEVNQEINSVCTWRRLSFPAHPPSFFTHD